MDGYSSASVVPLPEDPHRAAALRDRSVETAADGSLVVRFTRPLLETPKPSRPPQDGLDGAACPAGAAAAAGEERREGKLPGGADSAEDSCSAVAVATAAAGNSGGMEWLDPREEGVVLLWAFGRGAWPSYHDATGAFVLPHLSFKG